MKLSIKDKLKTIRDNYVINQVKNVILPSFESDVNKRYRVVFSGRVQKVGFRLEVFELAKRLNLTGFCRNLESGEVLAELQGASDKIDYLIAFMGNLKRIKIKDKKIEELEIDTTESDFLKL